MLVIWVTSDFDKNKNLENFKSNFKPNIFLDIRPEISTTIMVTTILSIFMNDRNPVQKFYSVQLCYAMLN